MSSDTTLPRTGTGAHVCLRPKRLRDTAGGLEPFETALRSVDRAVLAYSTLHAVAADPLEPEVEQRLQALLVDRVAPLLLRCLQTWEGGRQHLLSCADAASGRGTGWASVPAVKPGHATGQAGCCRRAAPQACTWIHVSAAAGPGAHLFT